jgi:HWE histidine kinase
MCLRRRGAAAALNLLKCCPEISLLFTDIVMPDVNGAKLEPKPAGVARQAFRKVPNAMQARAHFEARLMVLSAAHDVLTRESWDGASLRELIEGAVTPYRVNGRERFEIDGPGAPGLAEVRSRSCDAVSRALHERRKVWFSLE